MKPRLVKRYRFTILLLAALLPACAFAAGSATVAADGTRTGIYWADGMIRMNPGGQPGYTILRDGHIYTVRTSGSRTRVIDMTGMAQVLRGLAQSGGSRIPLDATVQSVTATGETAVVAGIEGRVYEVTLITREGETRTQRLTLTDDPLVVEMTRTYMTALSPLLGARRMGQLRQQLPAEDRGLLRAGDDYRLLSISDAAPNPAMFELPTAPTSLTDMLQDIIQRGMQQ